MKKKGTGKFILLLVSAIAVLTGVKVIADNMVPENSLSLISDNSSFYAGDEIEVKLYSDKEHTDQGAFEFHITYDREILEYIPESNVPGEALSGQRELFFDLVERGDAPYINVNAITKNMRKGSAMSITPGVLLNLRFKVKADYTERTDTVISIEKEAFENLDGKVLELNDGAGVTLHINPPYPGDYTAVDAALDQVPEDLSRYTDETAAALTAAVNNVNRDLTEDDQDMIDNMAQAIIDAIAALEIKPADYTAVDQALESVPEDLTLYTEESVKALNEAVSSVNRDLLIDDQKLVDEMAAAINSAVEALEYLPADYSAVETVLAKIPEDLSRYTEETVKAINDAVNSVERGLTILDQDRVDAMAAAIEEAVGALDLRSADYSAVGAAIAKVPEDLSIYTKESVEALNKALDNVERGLSIDDQERVDAMAEAIESAIAGLVEDYDPVVAFVTRLYKVCLDREPDAEGLNTWVRVLKNGSYSGIDTAYGFIFSREFKAKSYCDEHYVEYLYRAFMGREYDAPGKKTWMNALTRDGWTREQVFNGFAASKEFGRICGEYGIVWGKGIKEPAAGTVSAGTCHAVLSNGKKCGKEDLVAAFVTRLYREALNRNPEEDGLKNKTTQLKKKTQTARQISRGFYFSPEFKKKFPSDRQFVVQLYKGILGRAQNKISQSEINGKLKELKKLGREGVFEVFINSKEFEKICNKYGVKRK